MEAYFLSDIHLKSVNERNGQTLLRFLHSLAEKAHADMHLFLLGDIFDLWLSDHAVFVKKYQSLLEPIKQMQTKGVRLYYFEGNHDMHLENFWAKEMGAEVYTSAQYFNLSGKIIRCEHGDEINQEDLAYLRLRKFVRHPILQFAAHNIPGQVWYQLGQYLSRTSRHYSQDYRKRTEPLLIGMIRSHALRAYHEKNFDILIAGHMHVRDDYEFKEDQNTVRSINLGSWFDDIKVLKLTDKNVEWLSL